LNPIDWTPVPAPDSIRGSPERRISCLRRGFGRQGGIVPFRHSGLPARSRFGEGRRKPESSGLKEEFDVYTITALLVMIAHCLCFLL
jgi:hypothetical protein